MTLLQQRDAERERRRHELQIATRAGLRDALRELAPGQRVLVFGSLVRPGAFHSGSDIDLAVWEEPPRPLGTIGLSAALSERLGRPVDVLRLDQCRFRDQLLRDGETWTQ